MKILRYIKILASVISVILFYQSDLQAGANIKKFELKMCVGNEKCIRVKTPNAISSQNGDIIVLKSFTSEITTNLQKSEMHGSSGYVDFASQQIVFSFDGQRQRVFSLLTLQELQY